MDVGKHCGRVGVGRSEPREDSKQNKQSLVWGVRESNTKPAGYGKLCGGTGILPVLESD